ncbi:MAG: bifunctional diguanylate cyclase/phosphodiesterase [Neomegalonema sp.]|nr:bifunctional diguanylate cyclase/phosphodiesterase [Neomegalonema sp.]
MRRKAEFWLSFGLLAGAGGIVLTILGVSHLCGLAARNLAAMSAQEHMRDRIALAIGPVGNLAPFFSGGAAAPDLSRLFAPRSEHYPTLRAQIRDVRGRVLFDKSIEAVPLARLKGVHVHHASEPHAAPVKAWSKTAGGSRQLFELHLPLREKGKVVGELIVVSDISVIVQMHEYWLARFAFAILILLLAAIGIPGAALLFRIRDVRRVRQELSDAVKTDALTGALNRSEFLKKIAKISAIDDPIIAGGFYIAHFSVDQFKHFNDKHGQNAGDHVLKTVAARVAKRLGSHDCFSRLEGNKFALVVKIGGQAQAARWFERLNDILERPIFFEGAQLSATYSIGYSALAPSELNAAEQLHRADIARCEAKMAHAHTPLAFRPEMALSWARRRALETAVTDAIENERIAVRYQLINAADDERVIGAEALARLIDANGELIFPGDFVSIAEELGLINDLGVAVLRRACVEAMRWRGDVSLSVNVSPVQFRMPRFCERIECALRDSGLPPHRLQLEITEEVVIENMDEVREKLEHLRRLGVRIALDDFGVGYSSLANLTQLPFDCLKIDRSFVRDPASITPNERRMLELIIDIGDQLDMRVVVEGVETREQFALVKALRCDAVQGYLFGRPKTAAAMRTHLLERPSAEDAVQSA